MTKLDVNAALACYENARHRLPMPAAAGDCKPLRDLSDLSDRFETFLLDAFGVLNIGEQAIPDVPARIAALQDAGKRVMVLTNAASVPGDALVRKYRRLGYRFEAEDIVSSRQVMMMALRGEPSRRWGVMAEAQLQEGDLDWLHPIYLGDRAEDYEMCDGFLLLGSARWTEARQTMLEDALLAQPRPVWVANPDIVAPREHGFSTEPGFYAHRLADRTGVAPSFFGKPFANIFEASFDRLGPSAERGRMIMVGDSLHTDILGAQSAGIASAIIAGYGFLAGQSVLDTVEQTRIWPDYILERP